MTFWIWLAAPFIGIFLGLFGAGGGMLTVPLLVYGAGLPLKQAIVMSVWIVGAVSLAAAIQQRAWRVVRPGLLAFFGAGGILGGILGAVLGAWIAEWIQQLLFSLLVFVVAWWTLKIRLDEVQQPPAPCNCMVALMLGTGMGIVTGILGVGGGFLMVPTLIALGISHLPTAVAHSLVLITGNAFASGLTYVGQVAVALDLLIGISLLAGVGSLIGSLLLKRLKVEKLQRGFSVLLVIVGGAMLLDLLFRFF